MKTIVTIKIMGYDEEVSEALDQIHEQVSLINSRVEAFVEITSVEDSEQGSEQGQEEGA